MDGEQFDVERFWGGFSWGALLACPLWYLVNRLWLRALGFLALFLGLGLLAGSLAGVVDGKVVGRFVGTIYLVAATWAASTARMVVHRRRPDLDVSRMRAWERVWTAAGVLVLAIKLLPAFR
ncbi:hypothetical protein MX659_08785 [Coriobacteriia bacterium Es71-Z0120]|uniref:DUF2628 domain-containing protein n=1 Tax=Parvivirga hydrogeniphila TaxID=2939460 RepID=UPI002260CA0D|nr:DUF2628 domain-containing protein [Parvivirga hydrogeniphila]MCL4079678.1 hypothetical protein [Parvivirga hydrogeniphila]MDI6844277.1 hypothetical protein [Anaerosomatales bacterium]